MSTLTLYTQYSTEYGLVTRYFTVYINNTLLKLRNGNKKKNTHNFFYNFFIFFLYLNFRKFLKMPQIFDAILGKVGHSGCPAMTATRLAEALQRDIKSSRRFTDLQQLMPVTVDIPLSTNSNDRTCLAFVQIGNPDRIFDFIDIVYGLKFGGTRIVADMANNPTTPNNYQRHTWSYRLGSHCRDQCHLCHPPRPPRQARTIHTPPPQQTPKVRFQDPVTVTALEDWDDEEIRVATKPTDMVLDDTFAITIQNPVHVRKVRKHKSLNDALKNYKRPKRNFLTTRDIDNMTKGPGSYTRKRQFHQMFAHRLSRTPTSRTTVHKPDPTTEPVDLTDQWTCACYLNLSDPTCVCFDDLFSNPEMNMPMVDSE